MPQHGTELDWWTYAAAGIPAPTIRHRNRLMRLATVLMHGWPKRRRWD